MAVAYGAASNIRAAASSLHGRDTDNELMYAFYIISSDDTMKICTSAHPEPRIADASRLGGSGKGRSESSEI